MSVPPKTLTVTRFTKSSDRVCWFGPTEIGKLCLTVRFCVEAIYTPPPPLHSWRELSEQTYTSNLPVLRENHLLMCWGQDIPFLPYESWSLAFPSCFPLKSSFHQIQILWERVECWGDYHLKHKSKEFITYTPFVTSWRVVSPRLARCHLGASDKIMELNQGVC